MCAGPLSPHCRCSSPQHCSLTWRPSQALKASSSSRWTPLAWSSCLARAFSRWVASASFRCSSWTSGAGSLGGTVALTAGSNSGQQEPLEAAAARFQASRAAPAAAAARNTAAPHRASTRQARPGYGPGSAMLPSTASAPDGHEHLIGTLERQGHPQFRPARGCFPIPSGGAGSPPGARPLEPRTGLGP